MTEQEIERCLGRFTIGKATDVTNFDYSGTLAYLQRLKAENASLRERLERSIELPCIEPMTTYDWDDEKGIAEPHFGKRFQLLYRDEDGEFIAYFIDYIGLDKEEAEARLAELKGEKE